MANSLSHITNRLTQDDVAAGPATTPSASVVAVTAPPTSASTDDQPVKRKRGRPKGSVSKKPAEDRLPVDGSETKLKRPVGRPRKDGLPAGSVPRRTSSKRQKVSMDSNDEHYFATSWGVSYVPPPVVVPPYCTTAYSIPNDDSKYVLDEWRQLAQTRPPHDLVASLLTTFAAPNPTSPMGPTLEEAFKIHLQSLAPNPSLNSASGVPPSSHNISSLYSILKTFWLPSSPAYFTMAASASNTRMAMEYRFLYWDPQPLVFNGIQCPYCPSFLINNGRILSGPLKIYDIGKPFFIIGCEYVCTSPQCLGASSSPSSPGEGRKFGSTDASIMNSLPKGLKDEFPAKLLYGDSDAGSGPNIWNWNAMGVSTTLWNFVIGALGIGMRKEAIVHLVRSMQYGPPQIKYELKDEEKVPTPVRGEDNLEDDEEEEEDEKPDTDAAHTQPQHQASTSTTSTHTSPSSLQPYHRSHPQQPRQSPAFTHYSYSQYTYYPDQQQQQQQRATSSSSAPPPPPPLPPSGTGAGAGTSKTGAV